MLGASSFSLRKNSHQGEEKAKQEFHILPRFKCSCGQTKKKSFDAYVKDVFPLLVVSVKVWILNRFLNSSEFYCGSLQISFRAFSACGWRIRNQTDAQKPKWCSGFFCPYFALNKSCRKAEFHWFLLHQCPSPQNCLLSGTLMIMNMASWILSFSMKNILPTPWALSRDSHR